MKKKLLALLPALLLTLSACGGGGGSSGGGEGGGSSEMPTSKDATIIFYLDYNHADENDPYYKAEWYFGVPFTKDDIGLVDPSIDLASYSEFTTFLGWSMHPVIDSEDQLWKFGEDVKVKDDRGSYLQLFGIWVDSK